MAQICPACGSDNVQTVTRGIHCLERGCQKETSYAKLNETPQPTYRRETADAESDA